MCAFRTTDQKVGSSNLFERTEQHRAGHEYGGLKGPIRLTEGEAEPDPQMSGVRSCTASKMSATEEPCPVLRRCLVRWSGNDGLFW
jgi:hypothetical protein